jgi:pyruvate kinase
VLTPGQLGSRRHINLPGVKVNLPALTEKDRADVALGLELGFDYIAMSFVREAKDLAQMRALLAGSATTPLVIAKVEDQQAVAHFDEIAKASDGIMVARGDLGIEVPFEELPIIQRLIVKTCQQLGRPVIVATHMLESMIQNPLPTRAEITDVANAVYEQADAVMLSGETSVGKYPTRCVQVLDRVCRRSERTSRADYQCAAELDDPRQKLVKSAVLMANELRAQALLVFTRSGTMARNAAWMRPRHSPIFALCPNAGVAQRLALFYGVVPVVVTPFDARDPERTIDAGLQVLLDARRLQAGETIVVVSTMTSGKTDVDAVQMRVV